MNTKGLIRLFVVLLSCLLVTACGGDGDGDSNSATSGTGDLLVGLTDASTDLYQAVYVKIDEVQVHMGGDEEADGSWETVAAPMEMYNLLELVNGVIEELGTSPLDAGTYEQMRLIIGTVPTDGVNILSVAHPYANYVIDSENRSYELKIPSGINTGVKIVHSFTIGEDSVTELILDFDASASVVQAGTSGNWLLSPTISVLDTAEHAVVSGIVSSAVSQQGVEGALVSLQYETDDAGDEKDAVTVQTSTVSAEENTDEGIESGEYELLAAPGSYRLVSVKDGYGVGCRTVGTVTGETTVQDVVLAASYMGWVEGIVTINGGDSEQYATLSFRQTVDCGDVTAAVEVQSVSIANTYGYSVRLPVGAYSLVVSTSDMDTVVYSGIDVENGLVTPLNVGIGN